MSKFNILLEGEAPSNKMIAKKRELFSTLSLCVFLIEIMHVYDVRIQYSLMMHLCVIVYILCKPIFFDNNVDKMLKQNIIIFL